MDARVLLLAVLLAGAQTVNAQKAAKRGFAEEAFLPPSYITLGSFESNGKLYFECDGAKPFAVLNCRFTNFSLRKMTAEERAQQERAALSELDKAKPADLAALKSSMADVNSPKVKQLIARATPEQAEFLKDLSEASRQVAAAKDKAELKAAMLKMNQLQEQTCKIRAWQWEAVFERAGQHRWVSNPGPQGLCKVVRVQVLENSAKYQNLWKLTETILSADVDSSQLCGFEKDFINKPTVFSWDAPKTLKPGCLYLDISGGVM